MSLSGLRVVDDSNELPASMENWLNAGSDWTEHHGIDLCAAAPTVAEELFYAPPTSSEPVVARSPFLKLDALELCKESSLMGSDSSSSIESNSSSHDSPGNHTRKRPFDDLYAGPVPPAAGAAMAAAVVTPAGVVSMVPPGGAGILFPGAPLTLPTVPSMEEIAQSRPKRRNVKISTDPQSVAARHRRERISDRVRVLQHFVPGGTKMDTASMLDEAIHYVKFLQQQLQKLERLGNMSDARFMNGGGAGGAAGMMMPMNNISGGAMHHPFDLNYCNTTPYPTSMIMQQSHHQQHHHQQAQNPLCSHQSFSDHEQFCH